MTKPEEKIVAELAATFREEAGAVFGLKKAAALVGFSPRTISKAIASGALVVSRPGGNRVLVTARRLAEWVAQGETR